MAGAGRVGAAGAGLERQESAEVELADSSEVLEQRLLAKMLFEEAKQKPDIAAVGLNCAGRRTAFGRQVAEEGLASFLGAHHIRFCGFRHH